MAEFPSHVPVRCRGDLRRDPDLRFSAVTFAAAVALATSTISGAAGAQELGAHLPEVRTLLRDKHYLPALESLRLVAIEIQELRLAALSPALPQEPGGWTAQPPRSLLEEEELLSSRARVERVYTAPGPMRMAIEVDVNSPEAPAVAQSFNPLALAADPTARLVEFGGEKALVRFNADTREGEVLVLPGRNLLVRVTGSGFVSPETLVDLARRVDFPLLRSLSER